MKTDDICDYYANRGTKLTVRLLDDETVLLEGTVEALSFLGRLILAHVEDKKDGTQLAPNGPGQVLFSNQSTLGIYIHKIPCDEKH